MFSKLKLLFISLVLLIFVSGCSYFFGEKEEQVVISYNQEVASCLSESKSTFVNLFSATAEDELVRQQVSDLSHCYNETIESFVKYTKSGEENSEKYGAENLYKFFNEIYPTGNLTLETILSFMKIKHYLIGGDKESLNKTELLKITNLIEVLQSSLLDLIPHRGVLLGESNLPRTEAGYKQYMQATAQLRKTITEVLDEMSQWSGKREIDLSESGDFLLNHFLKGDKLQRKDLFLNLVLRFKNMSLNDTHTKLARTDLKFFIDQGLNIYESIVEFKQFLKDDSLFTNFGSVVTFIGRTRGVLDASERFKGVTLVSVDRIVKRVLEVISRGAMRNDDQRISYDKIEELVDAMGDNHFLGKMSARTVKTFTERFVSHWLPAGSFKGPDFTVYKVNYIKKALADWKARQSYINLHFQKSNSETISLADMRSGIRSRGYLKHWLNTLNEADITSWTNKNRVTYRADEDDKYLYKEISVSNSLYTLVQFFMRPFNPKKLEKDFVVSRAQAQEVYKLLRILGVELGFIDSRVLNSGERSFDEGNLFTAQKRRDHNLDIVEAYELMTVLNNSGITSDDFYDSIPQFDDNDEKCFEDYKDVLHRELIKSHCFTGTLRAKFSANFKQLGRLDSYWKSLDGDGKDIFIHELERASRGGRVTDYPVDLGEIRNAVSITYYMESIFHNFDKNKDNVLDKEEIIETQIYYQPFMANIILESIKFEETDGGFNGALNWVKKKARDTIIGAEPAKLVFTYILAHGKIPGGGALAMWRSRGMNKWLKNAKVDRTDVMKVFSAIAEASNDGRVKNIRKFLSSQKRSNLYAEMNAIDILSDEKKKDKIDCTQKSSEGLIFCEWARMMYCNEDINDEFFDWMLVEKSSIFDEVLIKENPQLGIDTSIQFLWKKMKTDIKFSTKCSFPHFDMPKTDEPIDTSTWENGA